MRLTVTGTTGQVALALAERAGPLGVEVVAVGRPALDLTQPGSVLSALAAARPDAIVSAAAHTAVDAAESEPEAARAVNEHGARAVALAAREIGVPLIHLSTDYVFAHDAAGPHRETDPVAPAGIYGATKLAGERAVLDTYGYNSAILRTAWVYSPFGRNFVKTMLGLAETREELRVVADQIGNPTGALDIADGVIAVARNLLADADPALRGVFHMTGGGQASWADFAEEIFAISRTLGGPSARVTPIDTESYPTPARRPRDSRLDCARIAAVHGVTLPGWHGSLRTVVARLMGTGSMTNNLAGATT